MEKLEALLAAGQNSASLRFALANGYLKQDDAEQAVVHARVAIELDPEYSAAWRLLGQAQVALGQATEAIASFEKGIEVAGKNGDRQVEKEMQVVLKRLRNASGSPE
jgi:Tfp pilus assembly protein PilF